MRFNKQMSAATAECHASAPEKYSARERAEFAALVRQGGEVVARGLDGRILQARSLAFLRCDGQLAGIAAIKRPLHGYRRSVSKKAGVELSDVQWPYELGWIFVIEAMRGKGHSAKLVQCALDTVADDGVFATSRTDNQVMHKTLVRFGFAPQGSIYISDRGDHELRLFLRR